MSPICTLLVLSVLVKCLFAEFHLPLSGSKEVNSTSHNDENEPRIFWASEVDIKDFPFFAGLRHCGGVIVSRKWILTAAHCVSQHKKYEKKSKKDLHPVWVGGNTRKSSKKYHYKRSVIHPKYNGSNNDLAMLKLHDKGLKFNDNVQPVELPKSKFCSVVGMFVGKGTDETGHRWQHLSAITMIAQHCSGSSDIFYATRYDRSVSGICHGDFGGPLVDYNDRKTLIGIAQKNYKPDCGNNQYTAFVDVFPHVDWIQDVMNNHKYNDDDDDDNDNVEENNNDDDTADEDDNDYDNRDDANDGDDGDEKNNDEIVEIYYGTI